MRGFQQRFKKMQSQKTHQLPSLKFEVNRPPMTGTRNSDLYAPIQQQGSIKIIPPSIIGSNLKPTTTA
jgi:hypothetical protein